LKKQLGSVDVNLREIGMDIPIPRYAHNLSIGTENCVGSIRLPKIPDESFRIMNRFLSDMSLGPRKRNFGPER